MDKFTSAGVARIAAERQRQNDVHGYTAGHDDGYIGGSRQLASAAACYALPLEDHRRLDQVIFGGAPEGWPWPKEAFRPGKVIFVGAEHTPGMLRPDRIRELEKAGALIAAAIDVELRHAGDEGTEVPGTVTSADPDPDTRVPGNADDMQEALQAIALDLGCSNTLEAIIDAITSLRVLGWRGMDMPLDAFLWDVRDEIRRARAKFPGSSHLPSIALSEEVGELCKAILDESAARVRSEAVQVACMAARVVLDGDASVDDHRERNGLDAIGGGAA